MWKKNLTFSDVEKIKSAFLAHLKSKEKQGDDKEVLINCRTSLLEAVLETRW